jgi:hypothetical protein
MRGVRRESRRRERSETMEMSRKEGGELDLARGKALAERKAEGGVA